MPRARSRRMESRSSSARCAGRSRSKTSRPSSALATRRIPSWFGDIYIMNADGSNVRRLTDAPGYDGGPFFSPDGKRIVWRHFDESGMIADVWTMKTDGSDKRRITDFKSMSWAPYYHPSGKYIIFTSNKLGFDEFRAVHRGCERRARAGARDLHGRLRWAAGLFARWQKALLDERAHERRQVAAFPRGLE